MFGDTNTDTVRSGNWYGNDTTWRMVLDLNRILQHADSDGRFGARPSRRFLSVVDGIVGGEGNGPLDATPRPTGVVLTGTNPVAVDLACARIMGFDSRKIPMLAQALAPHFLPLVDFVESDVSVRSNDPAFHQPLSLVRGSLPGYAAHFGWAGHIELTEPP
jgi:hypothetical protein